jgi:undecaprenyl-diphosphatase
LTVIQGITEFLPVSSSGHLVLVPVLTGWPDQGLNLDVAVHVGTLGAVLVYFWRDVGRMLTGLAGRRRPARRAGRALLGQIVASALPVLVAGAALALLAPDFFRNPEIIAWTMLGFGIVLYLADRFGITVMRVEHMTMAKALVIGLAQVLALVPGTSRSGITMSAARILGFERAEAARFSMLMSIPVIAAAGAAAGYNLAGAGDPILTANAGLAVALSFVTALLAIAALMRLLRTISFTPFVIYRVVLGIGLLVWLYALR